MNKRINLIISNEKYQEYLKKNAEYEDKRGFCTHDLDHFLDTARIGYILNLEKGLGIPKDIIYGAALLHDIGKWKQYKDNISHEIASVSLSGEILEKAEYSSDEITKIQTAILSHRDSAVEEEDTLAGILFVADKLSRKCFECVMEKECDWSEARKNKQITY